MGQNGTENPTGRLVVGKHRTAMRVPGSQENLSGKDLTEQHGRRCQGDGGRVPLPGRKF